MRAADYATANWRKSSRSNGGGGACVEVARVTDAVGIRDSKLGQHSPIVQLTCPEWRCFVGTIKQLDLQ